MCYSSWSTMRDSATPRPSAGPARPRRSPDWPRPGSAITASTSRPCAPPPARPCSRGRNHHAVGFGSIAEFAGGWPGYNATWPKSAASIARILQGNGYSTAAFGKWHLTPDDQQGAAGPFDRWPCGLGFDHFYGFLGGASGQYDPVLAENNSIIGVPEGKDYYLPDDLTERTIRWLHDQKAQSPDKPFFIYYSTGATHSPHHVPKAWADRYKGKFDQGWDKLREETFARQKELGVIPANAKLTPRDPAFPAWDSLTTVEKAFYARQMEVYAGFQENTDYQVGRVVQAIEAMGQADNTLILYIWGDNGSSMEGTETGTFNELTTITGIPIAPQQQLKLIDAYGGMDAWGGPLMQPHFACAWAWAGNAPFQWGKQVASHFGGTRNPMVVSWPARIKDKGGLRSQFSHVIDVAPTILEVTGITPPEQVDGIPQMPIHGTSFAYTFDRRGREGTPHPAVFRDPRQPRHVQGRLDRLCPPGPHSVETRSRNPQTVRARQRLGPRQGSLGALQHRRGFLRVEGPGGRASREAPRAEGTLLVRGREVPRDPAPGGHGPVLRARSRGRGPHPIHVLPGHREHRRGHDPARLQPFVHDHRRPGRPPGGAEGVIVAESDVMGGFALYVQDRRLRYTYSFLGIKVDTLTASEELPTGRSQVRYEFTADEPGKPATGGRGRLFVNDRQVGEDRLERTVPPAVHDLRRHGHRQRQRRAGVALLS